MSILNANQRFAEKKRLTVPVVKTPRKVKDALCIDRAYENGVFKIEPMSGMATYDQCYLFEDINYRNQDTGKKESILLDVMKWLKSMSAQFKITIASEQRDMEAFIKEVFHPLHGDTYDTLKEGIGVWVNQKIAEGARDIHQLLYLTVACRAKSLEEACAYFSALDTALTLTFDALKSRLYRLSLQERFCLLGKIFRCGNPGFPGGAFDLGGDGFKNQILPAMIRQEKDYLEIDGKYVTLLFAHDYDQALDDEKVIRGLLHTPFPCYITLDMEPVPKRLLTEKLLSAHTNNERTISQEKSRNLAMGQYGAGASYLLDKKKTELEELLDQVDDNDEEALFLGMLVLLMADSLEELFQRMDTFQKMAVANGYTLSPYYYRQLKALNTLLPIGGRQVNHMRSFLTSSAVAFHPFYARDLTEEGGFVYGLNRVTRHLLIGNRKRLKAPHGMIVGHTGSGKSYLVKETEIAQALLFTDDDILVVDPNNEQEGFIKHCRGQYFDFTPQSKVHLNPFEAPPDVWEGGEIERSRFIARKTEYAVSFCGAAMTNITVTQVHKTYIGRAVRRMYEAYFSQQNYRSQPTLQTLGKLLGEEETELKDPKEKRMLRDITDSLEEYTKGVYDMFAHPSNLDIHSRLVGFGLKNVPESVWEAAMVTMMHFIAMRMEHNQKEMVAARLVVDETQVLCEKGSSAAQLLYAVETYRKVGGVVTLVIQNLTRALENPDLRDMFSNCPYKSFLDQGGVDAASLAQIQELSASEFRSLEEKIPGRGVLVWDGQVYLFDARMEKDNVLYEVFNTDFHEKAADRKEREDKKSEGAQKGKGKEDADRKNQEPEDQGQEILESTDICDGDEARLLDLLGVCSMTPEELKSLTAFSRERVREVLEEMEQKGSVREKDGVFERTDL